MKYAHHSKVTARRIPVGNESTVFVHLPGELERARSQHRLCLLRRVRSLGLSEVICALLRAEHPVSNDKVRPLSRSSVGEKPSWDKEGAITLSYESHELRMVRMVSGDQERSKQVEKMMSRARFTIRFPKMLCNVVRSEQADGDGRRKSEGTCHTPFAYRPLKSLL